MNDRFLFRAKRIDNGEWVEGFLIFEKDRAFIAHRVCEVMISYSKTGEEYGFGNFIEVDPSTICQCTGLKDKNGKLIWENDIIKCKEIITAVSWSTKYASYVLTRKGWLYDHFFGESQNTEECEVIGNIFEIRNW